MRRFKAIREQGDWVDLFEYTFQNIAMEDDSKLTIDAQELKMRVISTIWDMASKLSGIPLSDLEALCNAWRDGRAMILPCKVGSPVWYIRHNYCKHADIHTGYCNADLWYKKRGIKKDDGCKDCPYREPVDAISDAKFRLALMDEKKVGHLHVSECYFTRAEAAAALDAQSGVKQG